MQKAGRGHVAPSAGFFRRHKDSCSVKKFRTGLQTPSRVKVGIISHVPILVERIGAKFVVEKQGGGGVRLLLLVDINFYAGYIWLLQEIIL